MEALCTAVAPAATLAWLSSMGLSNVVAVAVGAAIGDGVDAPS